MYQGTCYEKFPHQGYFTHRGYLGKYPDDEHIHQTYYTRFYQNVSDWSHLLLQLEKKYQ